MRVRWRGKGTGLGGEIVYKMLTGMEGCDMSIYLHTHIHIYV
jgi:hypothetical protein